jgi:hypothetical protein
MNEDQRSQQIFFGFDHTDNFRAHKHIICILIGQTRNGIAINLKRVLPNPNSLYHICESKTSEFISDVND